MFKKISGLSYYQLSDLKELTFTRLIKWQNLLRIITLVVISVAIFFTVFFVNQNINTILNNTEISSTNSESMISAGVVRLINSAASFTLLSTFVGIANKRIFEDHKRLDIYFYWYLFYVVAGVLMFIIPLYVPELSYSSLSSPNSEFVWLENISKLRWIQYSVLIFIVIEFFHSIYVLKIEIWIKPSQRRYLKSKLIALFFIAIYFLVFIGITSGHYIDVYNNFVLFGNGFVDQYRQDGISSLVFRFVGYFILLLLLFLPILLWLIEMSNLTKKNYRSGLRFTWVALTMIATLINTTINFFNNQSNRAAINDNNYILLGVAIGFAVVIALYVFLRKPVRTSSLYIQIYLGFTLFVLVTLHLIFNSIFGFSTTFGIINLIFISFAMTPGLIYVLLTKRKLEKKSKLIKLFYFFLSASMSLLTLLLLISQYFVTINDAINSENFNTSTLIGVILDFIFNRLNLWVLFYLLLSVLSTLTIAWILIRFSRSVVLINEKYVKKQQEKIDKLVFQLKQKGV
ncbi:hypothetical protein EI74_0617 [Mycoplasma testudineum]|uniref:Uncharacterized protein n=1 Tax=Mycoplasma testudineum TaxID=244584 RepID=A0A4R6ICV0_9MOLU|nr:hypothetical protein [Mycoplasma testudineum]OYD26683.1 hypothetical protein CG473_02690 [Mycoplasma testudineum]TDO19812.1 hypothetical protein EI74_0617 [Mycoplasma testudineum]